MLALINDNSVPAALRDVMCTFTVAVGLMPGSDTQCSFMALASAVPRPGRGNRYRGAVRGPVPPLPRAAGVDGGRASRGGRGPQPSRPPQPHPLSRCEPACRGAQRYIPIAAPKAQPCPNPSPDLENRPKCYPKPWISSTASSPLPYTCRCNVTAHTAYLSVARVVSRFEAGRTAGGGRSAR